MASGLAESFGHALRGLLEVAARERNMKIHVLAGTGVALAGAEAALPFAARMSLLFAIALVIGAEMANSSLEALVDLHTRELREEARRAKDAAAGAVLAVALGTVAVAVGVAVVHRDALEAALHRRGGHLVLVLGVVLLEAFLLFGRSGSLALDLLGTGVGAVLVAYLGVTGLSPAMSLVGALLFALAAASAAFARADARVRSGR
ncbi:MAG TPA: diacylglycerol kinase family protein [Anaeromyxobacteraceae bacterium]|nr:diacylglycerol kinase family protein [Anaeromyxobacteraceae bacterium]